MPLWLVMQESDPPQPGEVLQPVEVEVPSPSQNFSYMMQWWFFALVAVVGYLLILRKVARSGMPGGRSDVPESDPPEHVHA